MKSFVILAVISVLASSISGCSLGGKAAGAAQHVADAQTACQDGPHILQAQENQLNTDWSSYRHSHGGDNSIADLTFSDYSVPLDQLCRLASTAADKLKLAQNDEDKLSAVYDQAQLALDQLDQLKSLTRTVYDTAQGALDQVNNAESQWNIVSALAAPKVLADSQIDLGSKINATAKIAYAKVLITLSWHSLSSGDWAASGTQVKQALETMDSAQIALQPKK